MKVIPAVLFSTFLPRKYMPPLFVWFKPMATQTNRTVLRFGRNFRIPVRFNVSKKRLHNSLRMRLLLPIRLSGRHFSTVKQPEPNPFLYLRTPARRRPTFGKFPRYNLYIAEVAACARGSIYKDGQYILFAPCNSFRQYKPENKSNPWRPTCKKPRFIYRGPGCGRQVLQRTAPPPVPFLFHDGNLPYSGYNNNPRGRVRA